MFILIDRFANEEENSVLYRSPVHDEVDVDHILFSQISENEVAIDRFAGYAVVDRNPQPMLVIIVKFSFLYHLFNEYM